MFPFAAATGAGISANKIIESLMRQAPRLAPRISKALSAGISADQVLNFLSKDTNFERLKEDVQSSYNMDFNANPLVQAQGVRNKNLGSDMTSAFQRKAPAFLGSAAALGATMALKHALPSQIEDQIQKTQEPKTATSQPPVKEANIPQQQTLPQPEVSSIDVLKNANFTSKIDPMIDSGNDADTIAAFYKKFNPQAVAQIEKQSAKPFEQVISEYMQSRISTKPPEELPPETGGQEPPKRPVPPPTTGISGTSSLSRKAIQETFSKATPPAKGYIVETPDGIGEVKEIRNGKALVEVDGKMRKVLADELMSPGIPQQDLATLHDELIEGIKRETGKEVSRHVEWAGYDPEARELAYKPWMGEEYIYGDIDEEDANMLTSLLTNRKSTGQNFIGSWEAGTESPIGAAMHQLLTKLKEKAKESGKEKAHIRKYETVYSAYEPAQKASKRKKDEERKRLRAEEKRRKEKEKSNRKHSRSPSGIS